MSLSKLEEHTVVSFRKEDKSVLDLSGVALLKHVACMVPKAVIAFENKESSKPNPNFTKKDTVVEYCLQFGKEAAFDAEDFGALKAQILQFITGLLERFPSCYPSVAKVGCGRGIPFPFIQHYVDNCDYLQTAVALVRQALVSNDNELARTLFAFVPDYAKNNQESSHDDNNWAIAVTAEKQARFDKKALQFFDDAMLDLDEAHRFLDNCNGSKKLAQANSKMAAMLMENIDSADSKKRKCADEAVQALIECGWMDYVNKMLDTDVMSTEHTYSDVALEVIREVRVGNLDFRKYLAA
jgi:SAM-dependent methyltransferase